LTDLAVVHYDEAAPNHPQDGRLILPGRRILTLVGGLGEWNEGIDPQTALPVHLSGRVLLDLELIWGFRVLG